MLFLCTMRYKFQFTRRKQNRSHTALFTTLLYEGISKSFWIGRLARELQMVQLSATGCTCIYCCVVVDFVINLVRNHFIHPCNLCEPIKFNRHSVFYAFGFTFVL